MAKKTDWFVCHQTATSKVFKCCCTMANTTICSPGIRNMQLSIKQPATTLILNMHCVHGCCVGPCKLCLGLWENDQQIERTMQTMTPPDSVCIQTNCGYYWFANLGPLERSDEGAKVERHPQIHFGLNYLLSCPLSLSFREANLLPLNQNIAPCHPCQSCREEKEGLAAVMIMMGSSGMPEASTTGFSPASLFFLVMVVPGHSKSHFPFHVPSHSLNVN